MTPSSMPTWLTNRGAPIHPPTDGRGWWPGAWTGSGGGKARSGSRSPLFGCAWTIC